MIPRLTRTIGSIVIATMVALSLTACSESGKPSKEAVLEGMMKDYPADTAEIPVETVAKLAYCTVEKTYSTLSVEALVTMSNGSAELPNPEDQKIFAQAVQECALQLAPEWPTKK